MKENKRRVLITGGSRGIGAACVGHFAGEGDRVAFIYRANDRAAAEVSRRTGAFAVRGDVSVPDDARRVVTKAIDELGGLDVLVNNAGVAQFRVFGDITDDDWRTMIDTNLGGAFYCTRAALPALLSHKSGAIVNVSSVWGLTGASCEVHYSAAKAGLIGMTRALAKELGPSGITVNCVAPGVIDTDMNAALDDETKLGLANETPLGRLGTAREIARAVAFLSGGAQTFITGQVLSPNGGFVI